MKKGRSPSRARVGHRRGRDGAGPPHALYRVVRRLPDVPVVGHEPLVCDEPSAEDGQRGGLHVLWLGYRRIALLLMVYFGRAKAMRRQRPAILPCC